MKPTNKTYRGLAMAAALTLPGPALAEDVTTADGTGFDGALCEVNYSAAYDGGFYTNDSKYRNNVYQADTRHYITVLKFDLSGAAIAPADISDITLRLTVNGSTNRQREHTLAVFTGDDSLITESLLYDAANPFIDDAYVAETDTDSDFDPAAITDLLTYTNNLGGATDTIGSGDTNLRDAVIDALNGDKVITLIVYGGNQQYLTQGDEDPTPANRPTLSLVNLSDSDGDSLPDTWELEKFGDLSQSGTDDSDTLEKTLGGTPAPDGHDNASEFAAGSDPLDPDSLPGDIDGDDLDDLWEDQHFGNNDGTPEAAELAAQDGAGDPDGDLVTNEDEESGSPVPSDPNSINSIPGNADADTLDDTWELAHFPDIYGQNGLHDSDGDLYTNAEEEAAGTSPADKLDFVDDADGDNLNDRWEILHFGDLTGTDDEFGDPDGDNEDNAFEYESGSAPNNAASTEFDIDGDGLEDEFELLFWADIWTYDGDDDPDRDYSSNTEEAIALTDPTNRSISPDEDADGLGDGWEMFSFGDLTTSEDTAEDNDADTYDNGTEYAGATNGNDPLSTPDTDGDGLPEGWERNYWADETTQSGPDDSDGDGVSNQLEFYAGTDPTDPEDHPSPAEISTAAGHGADTYLTNDELSGPGTALGTNGTIQVRAYASRLRLALLRFDVSNLSGDLTNTMLRLEATFIGRRTRDLTVYGLVDGDPQEMWPESTTGYSNAPGIVLADADQLAVFARDPKRLVRIGTFHADANTPGTYLSNPSTLDLKSFIESDSNGVITLCLYDDSLSNEEFNFAARENAAVLGDPTLAPTLVVPNGTVTLPSGAPVITDVALDAGANTVTLTVAGLASGTQYHVETLRTGETVFTAEAGTTFTGSGDPQVVPVTGIDETADPTMLLRVVEGAEP